MVVTETETKTKTRSKTKTKSASKTMTPLGAIPKPKAVSPAKHAANVANAQRSTGPRSIAGKIAASQNSVSHGMTSKTIIFLEGESPESFRQDVDRLARQLGAVGDAEYAQVETVVYSRLRMLRAENADATAVNAVTDKIKDDFEDQSCATVRALIPLLPEAPDTTVEQLKNSSKGCAYLLEQWALISERLITHYAFEVSQRTFAIKLAGYRPNELFRNSTVRDWTRAYFGSIKGPD